MFGNEPFVGLDPDDRKRLADWLAVPAGRSVERLVDFAPRPWKVAGTEVVIGVFEPGNPVASWLLARYDKHWVLARVATQPATLSAPIVCDSLAEALDLIGTPGAE